jgi:hypothetical protein
MSCRPEPGPPPSRTEWPSEWRTDLVGVTDSGYAVRDGPPDGDIIVLSRADAAALMGVKPDDLADFSVLVDEARIIPE